MTIIEKMLDNIRSEYIGQWFIVDSYKYFETIPINSLADIRKMVDYTCIKRIGKICDLDICHQEMNGPVFKEGVILVKIVYETSMPNLREKKSLFVTYNTFLNELAFGDTEGEVILNYKLRKEVED